VPLRPDLEIDDERVRSLLAPLDRIQPLMLRNRRRRSRGGC
jgi:hypothetical protein